MNHIRVWAWSSTAQKFWMGLSGGVLTLFIVGHLLGNLQIFLGPEAINRYSAFLKSTGELLWVARIGLLAATVLHIATAISLTLANRRARPVEYAEKRYIKASYASRTMAISGVLVLAYMIYHLLHFTLRWAHPQYGHLIDPLGRHDVYSMMVLSFQRPLIVLAYVVANGLLGMHLSHGISSAFQSLGLNSEGSRSFLNFAGPIFGWGIFAGYAMIPLGVLIGLVKLPYWVILR